MRKAAHLTVVLFAAANGVADEGKARDSRPDPIIGLERAALDRWGSGDPLGYLELMAPGVTYFDPDLERRLDGLAAMKQLLLPLTGKIKIHRYEMVAPKVQRFGDIAVLTYNLVDYGKAPDGTEKVASRWNSTEVYRQVDGKWKIIHSHWSFTKPELKGQGPGQKQ